MFGVNNAELPQGKKYIEYGIQDVEIVDLVYNEEGSFDLKLKLVGASDEEAGNFRFFLTGDEKSINSQMRRFYEIVVAVDPALEQVSAGSAKEYINLMAPKLKGKQYTQKFAGRQSEANGIFWPRIPASGKTQARPEPTIAVPLGQGDSLTFDKDNEWDYRPYQGAVMTDVTEEKPSWD